MTWQQLINASLRSLGVLAAEEFPSASESADAQIALNSLLGSLSAQALPIFTLTRESFALSGAASYTIGTAQTFNTSRPVKIESMAVVNGASIPVKPATVEEWAAFVDKSATGTFAQIYYYDDNYPTGTIYLAPKPSAGNLEIYSYKELAQVADLSAAVSLPPGYQRALTWTLALELSLQFGRPIDQPLVDMASDAKMSIQGLNQAVLGRANTIEPPVPAVQK